MTNSALSSLIQRLNSSSLANGQRHLADEDPAFRLQVSVKEGDLSPGWIVEIKDGLATYLTQEQVSYDSIDIEITVGSSAEALSIVQGEIDLETVLSCGSVKFNGDFTALSRKASSLTPSDASDEEEL
ncbi:hypothetical protein SAMN02745225_00427 [Ferrithrix thermotolerans DSM 19514]|jgi:hypothetical protein|uniref:SCP-2 sterol transfer family protein n=1 Tax=Ferrithrix thermotolerans DSM 19514 TaxID=1121881 RepID=A0A1M4SX30_9ACTN|nr:hypothetical protein [Ferrithrix thermotolerans]SHE36762.1 hypothetical protein SAMN02745225_00427 [Ferrithrix thermotolerans DSM 19514]